MRNSALREKTIFAIALLLMASAAEARFEGEWAVVNLTWFPA